MAYQIRKSTKISEQLQLGDDLIIDVEINPSKMATAIMTGYNDIIRSKLTLEKIGKAKNIEDIPEQVQEIGIAFINLFNLIFGEENTLKIIDYFEKDYADMLEQILPFITDAVLPACKQAAKEKQEKAAKQYN